MSAGADEPAVARVPTAAPGTLVPSTPAEADDGAHPDDEFCEVDEGIAICYRVRGPEDGPPVVLAAGLGIDLTSWPDGFVQPLCDNGFRVVAFDNRDVGRSSRVDAPPPRLLRQLLSRPRRDAYDLSDMAADVVVLLDHLGIERAHLVGMSMGGMICQSVAATRPDRVASLTSVFSTTGHRRVGRPALSTYRLLAAPGATTGEEYAARHVRMIRHIGSAQFPFDEAEETAWAHTAWARRGGRSANAGVARQIGAIMRSGDRTTQVRRITAPTLVVHGDRDRMVHPSGGEATAAAIPGARHVVVPGLGHHFAPGLLDRLVGLVTEQVRSAAAAAPTTPPAPKAPTTPPAPEAPTTPPAPEAPTTPPAAKAPTTPPAPEAPTGRPSDLAPTRPSPPGPTTPHRSDP